MGENFSYPVQYPSFKNLSTPLSDIAMKLLEQSILDEGVRDKIVVWNNYILDGLHRVEICRKLGIRAFETYTPKGVNSKEDAEWWIINNQIQRCDLPKRKQRYLIGYAYHLRKKKQGGDRKSNLQSEDLKGKTADILSEEKNISRSSVERAYKFYLAVEHLSEVSSKASDWFLDEDSPLSLSSIVKLYSDYTPEDQTAIIELFINGNIKSISEYGSIKERSSITECQVPDLDFKSSNSGNNTIEEPNKVETIESSSMDENKFNCTIQTEDAKIASESKPACKSNDNKFPNWIRKTEYKKQIAISEELDASELQKIIDDKAYEDTFIIIGNSDNVRHIIKVSKAKESKY